MKKMMREFKEFALKGNVMSLAVGMIIGLAFAAVVGSLVDDILSPLIGTLARQNFDTLYFNFRGATIFYGAFITAVINFIIMAFVVFFLVKGMNKLMDARKKAEDEVAAVVRNCPYCFSALHDNATRCPHCTSQLTES